MVYEDFEKVIMAQSIAAVSSKTIWGGFLAILPLVLESLPEVLAQVVPVLPPQVGAIVSAVGGLLAILGRVNPEIKPISGVILK